jgi:class 3 adenylate cyclase
MTTQEVKRKLAAILNADVEGYSYLMGEDEEGTLCILMPYIEVMAGFIQHHRGRVFGTAGDSVMAEFASVVDAVQCAVEIQKELKTRNVDLAENRRMEFRIGINIGDVIEKGEQIYGDGVNIAARVQSLADGGGICISGTAYDTVKNKLELKYESMGERRVKNISDPVRVYRALMELGAEIDRKVVPVSTGNDDQESGGEEEPEILAQTLLQDFGTRTVIP